MSKHKAPEYRPWVPGSWHPARLRSYDSVALTAVLLTVATVRGLDYALPSAHSSPALAVAEQAFPIGVWGVLFLLPSMLLLVSALARIHGGVWMGHWILAIVYTALSVGLGIEYLSREWFDGIRSSTALALPAFLHLTIALRTGWRPLAWDPET